MKRIALLLLLVAQPLMAADPRPYHLELEANPAAPFPWLGRFGTISIDVYPAGVRAEALWLNSFSRNGSKDVTVMNPLGRMYMDVPVNEVRPMIVRMAGKPGVERNAKPHRGAPTAGIVKGIAANRHRLTFGQDAWIDYWTTTTIPANPQLRLLVDQLVRGVSPGTADVVRTIPGTPVYVELNFRRFKKLPLLKTTKFAWNNESQEDDLTRGSFYVRAGVLEALLK